MKRMADCYLKLIHVYHHTVVKFKKNEKPKLHPTIVFKKF